MSSDTELKVLDDQQVEGALNMLSGWRRDGVAIVKTYSFKSFLEAIAFVNRAAALANELDHHPDIQISYKEVSMRIWTHTKNALTSADIHLAQKIDEIAQGGTAK